MPQTNFSARHPGWSLVLLLVLLLAACQPADQPGEPPPHQADTEDWREELRDEGGVNPLLDNYLTPFSTPPFHRIEREHFLPALDAVIADNRETIQGIVDNPQAPDFDNTVEALERAGAELSRIAATLHGVVQMHNDPDWHDTAREFSTRLAAYTDEVRSSPALYERVVQVEADGARGVNAEQRRLLAEIRRSMQMAGAGLEEDARARLSAINRQLAELGARFRANLAYETQRFEMHLDDPADIEGLPEDVVLRATRDAIDRGHVDGWSFTLNAHSLFPFLAHSPHRDLRKTLYQAWQRRASGLRYGQTRDNGDLIRRIVDLRAERANLLGYRHHQDLTLEDSSVGNLDRIAAMLDDIEQAARQTADTELATLQNLLAEDGVDDELQPWDWWYYAERIQEEELGLVESDLREWFELDQVRDGAFALANRLWGVSFHLRTDLPQWHAQVQGYEVRDADGTEVGVLYLDFPHRSGKSGGAWMSSYRHQHRVDGERVAPIVANVANFPPPTAGRPILLAPHEVETLFHEFGHAMHGLLSDVRYRSLAGTLVPADFVEFPALLLERWALAPEVLRLYAFHYQTGAMIDQQRIDALQGARRMLAGLRTLEQVAAARIDLAWHQLQPGDQTGLEAMEDRIREDMNLPALLSPRHRFDGYESLFAGSRGGQDYRLLWSEVLAADAFASFVEEGLMNREQANRLRDEILARGNARAPMASWQAFRGREPQVDHLLTERGLRD